MDKPKIRVRTQRIVINGVNRYLVFDHAGRQWVRHSLNYDSLHDRFDIAFFSHADGGSVFIEDEQKLKRLLNITGGSVGDALDCHGPLASEYDLLPLATDITQILVYRDAEKRPDTYYCLTPQPFNAVSDFYMIEELSGRCRYIRYAVIEEIEFKVI